RGLDEQDRAAERRPGEASRDSGDRRALGRFAVELGLSQMFLEIALVDGDAGVALALRHLQGGGAAELPDRATQLGDAGLARVVPDDVEERVVGNGQLAVGNAVLLRALGHEVTPRDVDLLVRGVAAQLDDLESIPERRRERLERVRGAYEHDLGEVER